MGGKESVKFGSNPKFHATKSNATKATDIIMFVPGTTDPLNTSSERHQANYSYWRDNDKNFWANIKKLKPQFLDLHIEDTFFSWSGDNNTEERNEAAKRLLNLFLRVYSGFKNRTVHLHLIGHSHGGNVINQFTELISTDSSFPKQWEIKSITYLSTPFFSKKHQLNKAKLNKNCTLINVHNKYDITQQLIADFSLINLEILMQKINKDKFKKVQKKFDEFDGKAFDVLSNTFGGMNLNEGKLVWKNASILTKSISMFMDALVEYIESIETKKFGEAKKQIIDLLKRIAKWANETTITLDKQRITRKKFSRGVFFDDFNLLQFFKLTNELLAIKTGVNDSYLLKILSTFFSEDIGVTESLDITSWSPKNQAQGTKIIDIDITKYDKYSKSLNNAKFDNFLSEIRNAQKNKNTKEVLMRLISQFIDSDSIKEIMEKLNKLEWVITGDLDKECKKLRTVNLKNYEELIRKYNANLEDAKEKKAREGVEKSEDFITGSIPYLAMVSHSLSHTQLWAEVEKGLRSSFSSGVNPGYKHK